MGCTVDGTICTKCGHWAADETEMCPDIKYAKGNISSMTKASGTASPNCADMIHRPKGGVQFIEASWLKPRLYWCGHAEHLGADSHRGKSGLTDSV